MRVAALYDVHGILPALEAVLADPRCTAADAIVCGGDLVAGPLPAECLELLEADRRVRFLQGNGDRETVAPPDEGPLAEVGAWAAGAARAASGSTASHGGRRRSSSRSPVSADVLFCHATPSSDTDILTAATPDEDVAAALDGVRADVVVCGHTHVQYDRRCGRARGS